MALTAQNILDRAAIIIQDMTNVRWPATEIINWLNDGRRELAVVRPDVYANYTSLSLVGGSKQTLPAGGLRLLDAPKNTSGPAVTVVPRGFLDQQQPGWHNSTPSTTIKHFMLDERNPTTFWVYPPAASGASLDIIYQSAPADYTAASALTAHEELYGGALVDYICYRAFSKDSEYAGNEGRAATHYQMFANALGIGGKIGLTTSPNLNNIGGSPSRMLGTAPSGQ